MSKTKIKLNKPWDSNKDKLLKQLVHIISLIYDAQPNMK